MKILKEFKEFAVKGNMIDMAIGVIIGASFNRVIDVLVKQIFMPPLSILTGATDYTNIEYVLREAVINEEGLLLQEKVAIGFGTLFEVLLDFIIIAFTIFIVVKGMNRLRSKSQDVKDTTVVTPKDIELLADLKALMAEQNALLRKNSNS